MPTLRYTWRVVMECPKCRRELTLDRRQLVGQEGAFCHSAECNWHDQRDWRVSFNLHLFPKRKAGQKVAA